MYIVHRHGNLPSLLLLVLIGCTSDHPARHLVADSIPELRTDAAARCDPKRAYPFLLELPSTGGFVLNTRPLDSARLSRWFRVQLPQRAPEGRMIFVRFDSNRMRELRWLVPAIEAAGGGAYVPDSTCMRQIASRAPAA